jgi:proton-dependent oligopeptide transporter, POT family
MASNVEAAVIDPVTAPTQEKDLHTTANPINSHFVQHDDYDDVQGEWPTEEEFHTLRRVSDKIPWKVYTLAFVELCERFSYYGTTVVCQLPRISGA